MMELSGDPKKKSVFLRLFNESRMFSGKQINIMP